MVATPGDGGGTAFDAWWWHASPFTVTCFVSQLLQYINWNRYAALQSRFRTLVCRCACGVSHLAFGYIGLMCDILVCLDQCTLSSIDQDRIFTLSTWSIAESIVMCLIAIGGAASWSLVCRCSDYRRLQVVYTCA